MEKTAGAILRRARLERQESLRQAAASLVVAPSHLSRLERGEKGASRDLLTRAAQHYGLEPSLIGAGEVPADILAILSAHPEVFDELRSRYGE